MKIKIATEEEIKYCYEMMHQIREDLTERDIRTLLEGGSITNKYGDSAVLDVDYEYFVRIDYKEKKEDRDF